MNNKCLKERKNRKIRLLQNKVNFSRRFEVVDKCPICRNRTDGVTEVTVYYIEERLNDFILYLEKDKKRLKNLNKSKFDFLNKMVNKAVKELSNARRL